MHQSSTRGQSVSYTFDAVGQVTTIRDWANNKTTTYLYDLGGRRLRERVVQAGATYQDNHLAYDAQGNLRDVRDARARISMEYDRVGNRTRVDTHVGFQGVGGEAISGTSKFFKYDAMNRQVVVDAVDAAFNLGTQGHAITYDGVGNRTSDTFWGNKVASTAGDPVIIGYDEGHAVYGSGPLSFTRTSGTVKEVYRYDAPNRLQGVERDGLQIDVRHYDGADRVVQSGPSVNLPVQYAEVLNEGLAPGQMNGNETRINRYDANGRMLHQRILKSDNSPKADLSWDPGESIPVSGGTYVADGYDAAGNSRGYVLQNHEAGQVTKFSTTLTVHEGYREGTTTGVRPDSQGASTQHYDANGFLVGVTDSTQPANNRTFVNDAGGVALFVNQGGNVQRQLVVKGEVLGIYGAAVDTANATGGNINFANLVDFDFGYSRITAQYPSASPGAYQVRSVDTLQSIAQSAYGDSSLWYRIAEANGLGSSKDLKVGQTLNIPNRVSTISNNNSTFKPYDPSRINGDFSPNMPVPANDKGGCGGIGKLLMVVVAIVVTIYTAGAMSGVASGFAQTMSAGVSVMGGTGAAASAVGVSSLGTAGTLAVASAAGSVASQLVGLATGTIDKFDWKGVALSALSAGVSSALPANLVTGLGPIGTAAVRAGAASFITQGISVAVGLQKKFDWRGVAASAVGAGVGQATGEFLGMNSEVFKRASFGEQVGKRLLSGMAAGAATALARGGKVSVQQVAVDAFGNAVGRSIIETAMSSAQLQPTTYDLSSPNGIGEQSEVYDIPNAAGGLKVRGSILGLQLTSSSLVAMDEGIAEVRGHHALVAMRDAEIDAAAAAEVAKRRSLMQRSASASNDTGSASSGSPNAKGTGEGSVGARPQSALPEGWNMRDAHVTALEREYALLRQNSPTAGEWSGVTTTQTLHATARVIDAIATNPLGAAGFLAGKAVGLGNGGAAPIAAVASMAGELLAFKTGPKLRPSWRQSELDTGAQLEPSAYRAQVSFKNGVEVPYGTKGSTRPDYFVIDRNASVEVKNYNVEGRLGRDRLVANVSNQVLAREGNLPVRATQTIYIDARGQNVSREQLNEMIGRIVQRTNGAVQPHNVMVFR